MGATGLVTDLDGDFTLTMRAGQQLRFSYIGYAMLIHTVRADDPGFKTATPSFTLEADTSQLEEVVIVAGTTMIQGFVGGVTVETVESIACFSASGLPVYNETRCLPAPPAPKASVYPNPFVDRLNLAIAADLSGTMSAQRWIVQGQLVRRWPARPHEAGSTLIELPLGDLHLVPGHYILRYTDQAGRVESQVVRWTP